MNHHARILCLLLATGLAAASVSAQDDDRLAGDPLHYDAPGSAGLVELIGRRLKSGELELAHDPDAGYLPALLEALEIPVSSQVLVFSKTSFQNDLISPATPRAVFFGDAAYVGSIPGAPLVEITSIDPERGPLFYTLDQRAGRPPRFTRRDDECLACHSSPRTRGWPGNIVRSVHPDAKGHPILRSGTDTVTHATPFDRRWGGWYVTGTHGDARHRGNTVASTETEMVDPEPGANIVDLSALVDTEGYLSPHSDLVALMVLEHQAEMHNLIARASYEVRLALHRQEEMNRFLDDPPGTLRDATVGILESQAEKLLAYMLFEDEFELPAPIRGTSDFAAEFQARGARDDRGRSLRDLDLNDRVFSHRCSYVIHSPAFDGLPPELLERVYRGLWKRLDGTDAEFVATREILQATKGGLPEYWR